MARFWLKGSFRLDCCWDVVGQPDSIQQATLVIWTQEKHELVLFVVHLQLNEVQRVSNRNT